MYLFIIVVVVGILIPVVRMLIKKSRLTCKNCKTKLSYDDIIDVEEGGTRTIASSFAFTDVHVLCQCPKCGKEHSFKITFKSGEASDSAFGGRNITVYNLNEKLRKYFGGKRA